MNQHTGNWPGKTVSNAEGKTTYKDTVFHIVDLPGTYSLSSDSPDEKVAGEYICSGKADIVLIIADATCLERNLLLVKDILTITGNAVLCVNLMDEAEKKESISISKDSSKCSEFLLLPLLPAQKKVYLRLCEFYIPLIILLQLKESFPKCPKFIINACH